MHPAKIYIEFGLEQMLLLLQRMKNIHFTLYSYFECFILKYCRADTFWLWNPKDLGMYPPSATYGLCDFGQFI